MTPRKAPSDEQLREAVGNVGDALQRAVVLSSDRVQSVLEDAVVRGRMTRRDAEELAASLVSLGREQALELRGEVDALARSVAEAVDPRAKRKRKRERADEDEEARREADRFVRGERPPASPAEKAGATAKPATSASRTPKPTAPATPGTAPEDPAALTVKELVALLPTLSPSELQALRAREAAGKARATLLKAIDQKATA